MIWLTLIVFSLFNFLVARRDFYQVEPPKLWLDNMLAKCGIIFNENTAFINPAFIKMAFLSCPFGGYIGILYEAGVLKTGTPPDLYQDLSLQTVVVRFLTLCMLVSPLLMPYFLISNDFNVYVLFFLKTSLPFFLSTIAIYAFGKSFHEKLNLL